MIVKSKLFYKCISEFFVFDNDVAGKKATNRFNKMIRKDVIVTNLFFKDVNKKDINELTIQEFDKILDDNGLYFRYNR